MSAPLFIISNLGWKWNLFDSKKYFKKIRKNCVEFHFYIERHGVDLWKQRSERKYFPTSNHKLKIIFWNSLSNYIEIYHFIRMIFIKINGSKWFMFCCWWPCHHSIYVIMFALLEDYRFYHINVSKWNLYFWLNLIYHSLEFQI